MRSSEEINWVLQRNLQFLQDYLRFDRGSAAGLVDMAVKAVVQAEPGILLSELFDQATGAKRDDVFLLIASGEIYVDLAAALIVEPQRVRVFANAATASAYPQVRIGESGSASLPAQPRSEAFNLLSAASEHDLTSANERLNIVKRHMEGGATPAAVPARTLRLWLARYGTASEKYGNGYVGLLPKTWSDRYQPRA